MPSFTDVQRVHALQSTRCHPFLRRVSAVRHFPTSRGRKGSVGGARQRRRHLELPPGLRRYAEHPEVPCDCLRVSRLRPLEAYHRSGGGSPSCCRRRGVERRDSKPRRRPKGCHSLRPIPRRRGRLRLSGTAPGCRRACDAVAVRLHPGGREAGLPPHSLSDPFAPLLEACVS